MKDVLKVNWNINLKNDGVLIGLKQRIDYERKCFFSIRLI